MKSSFKTSGHKTYPLTIQGIHHKIVELYFNRHAWGWQSKLGILDVLILPGFASITGLNSKATQPPSVNCTFMNIRNVVPLCSPSLVVLF